MARNEEKLRQSCDELATSNGQQHRFIVTDFNRYNDHKRKLADLFAQTSIDILVNNTNGPMAGGVFAKGEADFQQAFELLFQNAVYTTQLAIPAMQKRGFGRVINVSSMTVKEPSETLVLSNTMRTALVSWSKSLASEVAPFGITVNSILTGFFDTDRLNSLMKLQAEARGVSLKEVREERISMIPIQRLGDPAEYGYLASFLASESAAFLTGTVIPLDGGASVGLF